jgi:hypothetical protein
MAADDGVSRSTATPAPASDHPAARAMVTPAEPVVMAGAVGVAPLLHQPIQFHAAGNLGRVLRAQDPEPNRSVALKRIQERPADNPESRPPFLREAEIVGRLGIPAWWQCTGWARAPKTGVAMPCASFKPNHSRKRASLSPTKLGPLVLAKQAPPWSQAVAIGNS